MQAQTGAESYSYAELARRFGVTTRTLRNWRAAGRLKPAVAANGKRVTRLVIVADDAASEGAERCGAHG